MNSCFIKELRCFFCCERQRIERCNFPEDAFDLISRYKIDQLFWSCSSCKNDPRRMISKLTEQYQNSISTEREINVHMPAEGNKQKYHQLLCAMNDVQYNKTKWETVDADLEKVTSLSAYALSESSKSESPCSLSRPESPEISLTGNDLSLSPPGGLKANKNARKYVHSILNMIKINPKEDAKNREIVTHVLNTILSSLRKNKELDTVISGYFYTGSAYNDLKITSASEYDVDLVVKVPKGVRISLKGFDTFVMLKCVTEANVDSSSPPIKFFNEISSDEISSDKCYLQPQKLVSWLQRHLDFLLKQELKFPEVSGIKQSASGPARTIKISTIYGDVISVDLVPVFKFDYSILSGTTFYHKVIAAAQDKNNDFYVVPKQCIGEEDISIQDCKFTWRLDFPAAEKNLLQGKECAKSVIKMMKIFRDKADWKGLASYYLKMVVLLEIIENRAPEHWQNGNLYERYLDCMKKLKDCLKGQTLCHFITEQNLLFKFKKSSLIGWSNHLEKYIKSAEANPETLETWFPDKKNMEK